MISIEFHTSISAAIVLIALRVLLIVSQLVVFCESSFVIVMYARARVWRREVMLGGMFASILLSSSLLQLVNRARNILLFGFALESRA